MFYFRKPLNCKCRKNYLRRKKNAILLVFIILNWMSAIYSFQTFQEIVFHNWFLDTRIDPMCVMGRIRLEFHFHQLLLPLHPAFAHYVDGQQFSPFLWKQAVR